MHIELNGERHDLACAMTAAELVEHLGLAGQRLAMEINQEILPRSRYGAYALREGDRVEIVRAIGGG